MKAEISRDKRIASGWFWKIKIDEYSSLMGYAFTRKGAEWGARRDWKQYNKPNKRYEIEL